MRPISISTPPCRKVACPTSVLLSTRGREITFCAGHNLSLPPGPAMPVCADRPLVGALHTMDRGSTHNVLHTNSSGVGVRKGPRSFSAPQRPEAGGPLLHRWKQRTLALDDENRQPLPHTTVIPGQYPAPTEYLPCGAFAGKNRIRI
jgi:hypothetical protein